MNQAPILSPLFTKDPQSRINATQWIQWFSSLYVFLTSGLSGTKVYYVSDTPGGATTRKITIINGVLTKET